MQPGANRRSDFGVSTLAASRGDVAVRQSRGTGQAILLIHGEGESMAAFAALFESAFAGRHHLVTFDLPGHGASGEPYDPESACTADGYADLALEVLERLGVDSAFVVDRSLGGRIGREMFMIFPEMLGLALVRGGGREDHEIHAPIYEIDAADESNLTPALAKIAEREPRVWFGG